MLRLLLCFALMCSCSISFSGTRHPQVSDEKLITYGQKFIHTVVIMGLTKEDKRYIGSGVAIGKNIVLTAAHVVSNAQNGVIGIPSQKKLLKIKHTIIHSKFKFENVGKYDIAILILNDNMDYKWYPKLYTDTDELNQVCSVSGYGAYGTFETGISKELKPTLRAGSNCVDEFYKDLLICDASKDQNTSLEYLINIGDSGGPLYINNKIAGINSVVIAEDGNAEGNYGDKSGHTRVSLYVDWIVRNMEPYLDK